MRKCFMAVVALALMLTVFTACGNNQSDVLSEGDKFTVTGTVDYSDEPSDIGQEYCFITGDTEIEYTYTDIYGEQSQWSSDTFFTRGDDTALLKEYVGKTVTVSGTFSAESHGIPYITEITIK